MLAHTHPFGLHAVRCARPQQRDAGKSSRTYSRDLAVTPPIVANVSLMPQLSICIPTYNMGRWVGGAVQSALALGHEQEVEVTVFDNCSTDDTQEVLAALGAPNLHVVSADEHVGMATNWNRAVRASRGNWVTVLSADDELLPLYYEHLRGELHRTDTAVFSQLAWKRASGYDLVFGPSEAQTFELAEFVAMLGGATNVSTSAFRRDVFEQVGGFDPDVGPVLDFDLFFRMATTTGLPIRALGVAGGIYHASRGATWAGHEEQGEAGELALRWIALRRSTLGPELLGVARRALAQKSRIIGRASLAAGNRRAAAREFAVALSCTDGRGRTKLRIADLATRLPAVVVRPALRAYSKARRQGSGWT